MSALSALQEIVKILPDIETVGSLINFGNDIRSQTDRRLPAFRKTYDMYLVIIFFVSFEKQLSHVVYIKLVLRIGGKSNTIAQGTCQFMPSQPAFDPAEFPFDLRREPDIIVPRDHIIFLSSEYYAIASLAALSDTDFS